MRTVVQATLVGTTLETYDLVLYAQAAALVFGNVFFPRLSPASGQLASLSTFAVAFVARPVGAVVFGHFGDRIGRRATLIATMVLTGGATLGIGLLPGYRSIGIVAPATLVLLRFLQGVGLGGEWPGAILLAAEHAPPGRRGAYTSFTQMGTYLGLLMATGVMLTLSATLADDSFLAWGWRIPFVAGGVLMAVGLYLRLAVTESPLFVSDVARSEPGVAGNAGSVGGRTGHAVGALRLPLWEAVRRPRMLLLGTGALMIVQVMGTTVSTFALAYAVGRGVTRTAVLSAFLTASAIIVPVVGLIALLSDRLGRRPLCLAGAVAAIAWSYPLLALIDTRSALWITVAFLGGLFVASLVITPMGAYLPELFETRMRYSGVALSSNLAAILGGGLTPIIATALLTATGSAWWIAGYVAATASISLVCILALPETYQRDLPQPADSGA